MIEVKVLREHGNSYGDKYTKAKGSTYSLPEEQAATLADQGLVKLADGKG